MHVTFLVPDIHDAQTGGNVYNRRMADQLRTQVAVEVVPWNPDEEAVPPDDLCPAGVLLVDSLLVRRRGVVRTLREQHPDATVLLLGHYLQAIDPSTDPSPTAEAERAALATVDGAIATSRYTRDALVSAGLPADCVRTVRPGLDERFRGPLPARLGTGPPRLLTVANLLPEKGLLPFVDALAQMTSRAWSWTLVGDRTLDRDYAQTVRRRVRTTGLAPRTTRTGTLSPAALRAVYDRADLFVLPSPFETLSMSAREAMARGLPVVAYDTGGLRENFGGADAGHLVTAQHRRGLAAALRSLIVDPTARRAKGRSAWGRSRAFPSWGEAGEQFLTAVREIEAAAGDG